MTPSASPLAMATGSSKLPDSSGMSTWEPGNGSGRRDLPDGFLEIQDVFRAHDGARFGEFAGRAHLHDGEFLFLARVANVDQKQEPVELRFGQRVGAFLFERVLRREDEERVRQRMRG